MNSNAACMQLPDVQEYAVLRPDSLMPADQHDIAATHPRCSSPTRAEFELDTTSGMTDDLHII